MAFNYVNKIKLILIKTGWSQQTLARKIGCTEKQMSFWMTGKAKPYNLKNRDAIDRIYLEKVEGQQTMFDEVKA